MTRYLFALLLLSACGEPAPLCGDAVVDPGEDCDGAPECRADCTLPRCGDGLVDAGEACDDANDSDADACLSSCVANVCGDGLRNPAAEACDDGNAINTDDCKNDCSLGLCGDGVLNPDAEACDDANTSAGDGCRADCAGLEQCGDGLLDSLTGEVCDDGNASAGDGCRADCAGLEQCGDGLLDLGELCDDLNTSAGDGCRADCQGLELCGDGLVDAAAGEVCDDLNTSAGDGCRADCAGLEQCGDGLLDSVSGEACDDGNAIDNDGCDADCLPSQITHIAAGEGNTCVSFRTGGVRCWGDADTSGLLGYGNLFDIGDDEFPSTAGDVQVGGRVVQLAPGGLHTCALLDTGAVRCWGTNSVGALGYGIPLLIGDNEFPEVAGDVPLGGTAVQIAAGGLHTCALLDTGAVRCWGRNQKGELGYGNTLTRGDNETPAAVGDVPLGGVAVQINASSERTCALLDTGAIRCWGEGFAGSLGYGNQDDIGDNETPAAVGDADVDGPALQLEMGFAHTCALFAGGSVRCWGTNSGGQLGYGNTLTLGDNESPSTGGDIALGGVAVEVVAGDFHTCARLDTGAVRCWGSAAIAPLGYGNTNSIGDNEAPETAGDVPLGGVAVQLTAEGLHTCALLTTGRVRCWGNGLDGRLGYGNEDNVGDDETPADVGDVPVF